MAKQQLDLFQFPARSAAQLCARTSHIVGSNVRDARCHHVRLQHLPDDLFAHLFPADLIAPVDGPASLSGPYHLHALELNRLLIYGKGTLRHGRNIERH